LYLIDKKTSNVCLLFKFMFTIQIAQNVMTYLHSPHNSSSLLYFFNRLELSYMQ